MSNRPEIMRHLVRAIDSGIKVPSRLTKDETLRLAETLKHPDGRWVVPRELLCPPETKPAKILLRDFDDSVLKLPPAKHDRCVLVIAPDDRPQRELDITRPGIQRYASAVQADYIEILRLPFREHKCNYKLALSNVAKRYEQTLYLDTDVVVMEGAEDVFDEVPVGSWGLVDDYAKMGQTDTGWFVREWEDLCRCLGVEIPVLRKAWNSGVVVAPQDASVEYHAPTVQVPNVWCVEQHYHTYCLHKAQDRCPERVIDMADKWNAGFPWRDFPESIKTANFIHINGSHGPHKVRLRFLSHFAAGNRDLPGWIKTVFDGSFHKPWWLM